MVVTIQKIGVEQVQALAEISRETYYDTFIADNTEEGMQLFLDEAYALPVLKKELENPESDIYFLYEEDGQIAAYLKLNRGQAQTEDVHENALEIQRIYVRPSKKRKGYGTLLIDFALGQADQLGCDAIWLGVWEHNYPAQAFYKSHGFYQVGQHEFPMGDKMDIDYIYLKDLKKVSSK